MRDIDTLRAVTAKLTGTYITYRYAGTLWKTGYMMKDVWHHWNTHGLEKDAQAEAAQLARNWKLPLIPPA